MASPSAPTKKQIHQLIRAWEKLGGPDNCTRVRLARSVGMPRQTVNDWIERGAPRYGIPIPVKTEKPIEIIHKEKIETQDKKSNSPNFPKRRCNCKRSLILRWQSRQTSALSQSDPLRALSPRRPPYGWQATGTSGKGSRSGKPTALINIARQSQSSAHLTFL